MRLQHAMLAAAMSHPATTADFYRQRAEAEARLKDDARQRDADVLAKALALCTGRYFTDRGALLVFLTDEEKKNQGRALTLTETARTRRITDVIWAIGQDSGMAVLEDAPTSVCAWCTRLYEQAQGFGIFCSRACMIEECNAPGGIDIATRPA